MGGRPELGTEPRCNIIELRRRGRSTGEEGGRDRNSRGAASVTLTLLPSPVAFPILLPAAIDMAPTQMYWYSREVAASSALASATITSKSEGWCTQMNTARKPYQSGWMPALCSP